MRKAFARMFWGWLVCWTPLVGVCATSGMADAAEDVVIASADEGEARLAAIARLREQGPAGLRKLIEYYGDYDLRSSASPMSPVKLQELAAIDRAIDQVGGAVGSRVANLYWYTDMAQAQAAARDSGKPILALFLLGKLTDEYSCANSRFFRATLYSNGQVSEFLRANFTLVWQTVRPVPRITIDFGDGRKLERTITGNSVHYVVTSDGWVADALPGLFGPAAFLQRLEAAGHAAKMIQAMPLDQRAQALTNYHLTELRETARQWTEELDAIDAGAVATSTQATVASAAATPDLRCPTLPPLEWEKLSLQQLTPHFVELERRTTDLHWEQLSQRHAAEAEIDETSRAHIAERRPLAARAGRLAITKSVVENPLLRLVRNLQYSIARDTVHNEYQLHRKFRVILAHTPTAAANLVELNARIYEDLFLMPLNDPWLGLAPPDVYTGLPNNGVVQAEK